MAWLLVLIAIVALLAGMLFATVELFIDTRVPAVTMRLQAVGKASVFFEEDTFWLRVELFFWRMQWRLTDPTKSRKGTKTKRRQPKKNKREYSLTQAVRRLKCFRIRQFRLFLQPGDYALTAQLYPLNFFSLPYPYKFSVGFTGESYLLLKASTAPWRVLSAWLRN